MHSCILTVEWPGLKDFGKDESMASIYIDPGGEINSGALKALKRYVLNWYQVWGVLRDNCSLLPKTLEGVQKT